jgi:hypothetical protein
MLSSIDRTAVMEGSGPALRGDEIRAAGRNAAMPAKARTNLRMLLSFVVDEARKEGRLMAGLTAAAK